MGWLFGWKTKLDLIKHCEGSTFYTPGYKALKHRLLRNNHWTLLERPDGSITISLEMLSHDGGDWGYKGVSEDMGPYQLDCPISFLQQASDPQSEYAKEWREKVMAAHQDKRSRPDYSANQVWALNGKEYRLTERAGGRKGWIGILIETGVRFRIPFVHLSKATFCQECV